MTRFDEPLKVGWSFEPGISFVFGEDPNGNSTDFNFIGYAKFGPESKITKSLLVGLHVGAIIGIVEYPFLIPYAGISSCYFIPMSNNANLEIEFGLNTSYKLEDKLPYHLYLSVGAALD